MGDARLLATYQNYLMWCRVWDVRKPPSYKDWLTIRDGKAKGERTNFVIGWEGVK
jgi:hypothetical protein